MITPRLVRGAWTWTGGLVVDGDGAPSCYAPSGSGLHGLDYLANAMNGDRYVGVVCVGGEPHVQGPDDPCPGYFVSPSSLRDRTKPLTDPTAYVDASTVPYLAICPELRSQGVDLGDLAVAIYRGRHVAMICADVCPHNHYGEASIAAAQALGIPSSPRDGGVSGGVTFLVFPGSRTQPAWPRSVDSITAAASVLFDAWGGMVAVA